MLFYVVCLQLIDCYVFCKLIVGVCCKCSLLCACWFVFVPARCVLCVKCATAC